MAEAIITRRGGGASPTIETGSFTFNTTNTSPQTVTLGYEPDIVITYGQGTYVGGGIIYEHQVYVNSDYDDSGGTYGLDHKVYRNTNSSSADYTTSGTGITVSSTGFQYAKATNLTPNNTYPLTIWYTAIKF